MRVSDKDATVTQGGGGGGAGGKVAPEVKHWKGYAEAAKWAGEAAQVWNGYRCGGGCTGLEGAVLVWRGVWRGLFRCGLEGSPSPRQPLPFRLLRTC